MKPYKTIIISSGIILAMLVSTIFIIKFISGVWVKPLMIFFLIIFLVFEAGVIAETVLDGRREEERLQTFLKKVNEGGEK